MNLKDQIHADLNLALKARDKIRVDTLRMLRAEIQKAEIAAHKDLADSDVVDVIGRYAKQVRESIEGFAKGARAEQEREAKAELVIVESYLPTQLSDEDVTAIAKEAIADSGAKSAKEMGAVMSLVMPKVKGRADGKKVNQIVKSLLGSP